MEEEKRNKFQSYMELAQAGFQRGSRRRSYEWKVSFGLWTALAVMISFIATGGDLNNDWINPDIFYASQIIVFLAYLIWTAGIQIANRIDHEFGFHYEHKAELMVDPEDKYNHLDPISKSGGLYRLTYWLLFPRKWSYCFQIGITLTLLLLNVAIFEMKIVNIDSENHVNSIHKVTDSDTVDIVIGK